MAWRADDREGRELRTPQVPPPPPPPPEGPKKSGPSEGPDKRRARYLVRRALFAFEEALGLYAVLGTMFPDLQRVLQVVNLPNVLTNIIVALRNKLAELHDEGEPMADIPRDDSEQIAMQYLGEIPQPACAAQRDMLSGEDLAELSRKLGAIPESSRIATIQEVVGPEVQIGSPEWQNASLKPDDEQVGLRRWVFVRLIEKLLGRK
ncbi:hypothetical protein HYV71_03460 [Candidatus Uhrbacteria bacterium]|nr:hypothetical protein [Candidatus Uhrbacteria bacterium]